jgi:hypothetical protein
VLGATCIQAAAQTSVYTALGTGRGHVGGGQRPAGMSPQDTWTLRMPVGDQLADTISTCTDPNGNPVVDTVTYSVSGQPMTGGSTATFSENPVPTTAKTVLTITAPVSTKPGNYTIVISRTGNLCNYGTSTIALALIPIVTGSQTLWWFNGQTPSGYKVNEVITTVPSNLTSYQWNASSGVGKIAFDNNGI